jgi:hypothetical protein
MRQPFEEGRASILGRLNADRHQELNNYSGGLARRFCDAGMTV